MSVGFVCLIVLLFRVLFNVGLLTVGYHVITRYCYVSLSCSHVILWIRSQTCTPIHMIYIYICIEREREKEIERYTRVCIYIYIYIHTHVYRFKCVYMLSESE